MNQLVQALPETNSDIVTIRWSDNRVTACGWMRIKNLADIPFYAPVPQLHGFLCLASIHLRAGHSAAHAVSPKTFTNAFEDLPE